MVNIVSIQENSTVQNTIISIYVNGWVRFGLPVRYHSGLNFWSGLGLPFRYVSLVLFGYKENKERLQKVHKNCKYFLYIKRKESGLKYTYLYFCVFGVLFIRAATFSDDLPRRRRRPFVKHKNYNSTLKSCESIIMHV